MSPHCTTLGYATWEHSSFSVMWSRQLPVFPEDHCEQTLNPQLVGSGPTAGLCSNTQICEAGWTKLVKSNCKNRSSRTCSVISHFTLRNPTFALLDLMLPPAPVAAAPVGLHLNKHIYTHSFYFVILDNGTFPCNGWLEGLRYEKDLSYFPLLQSIVVLLNLFPWYMLSVCRSFMPRLKRINFFFFFFLLRAFWTNHRLAQAPGTVGHV